MRVSLSAATVADSDTGASGVSVTSEKAHLLQSSLENIELGIEEARVNISGFDLYNY